MTAKRPLFKRPAWAADPSEKKSATSTTTTTTANSNGDVLFGRQRIYEDLIALERKEKEEKKREQEREKERSKTKVAEHPPSSHPPKKKKQRLSDEDNAGDGTKSDAVVISLDDDKDDDNVLPRGNTAAGRGADTLRPEDNNNPNNDNDDNDNDSAKVDDNDNENGGNNGNDNDDGDDDLYLQRLRANAREDQRLQSISVSETNQSNRPVSRESGSGPATVIDSTQPSARSPSAARPPVSKPATLAPVKTAGPTKTPTTEFDDTEVSLYIHPLIPNTKALIVTRKASQPLDAVKVCWCQKQQPSLTTEAERERVFFVWRDMKLYNSSTMRHILKRLERERKPGQKESGGRIVLYAVTQEIYDAKREELATGKLITATAGTGAGAGAANAASNAAISSFLGGSNDHVEEQDDGRQQEHGHGLHSGLSQLTQPTPLQPTEPALPVAPVPNTTKFIIRLISKEYGELPIRIRPESTVRKIAAAYMQQVVVPQEQGANANKVPYLIFDGDRLQDEQTAQEVGLEEGDVVEVQFRHQH